MQKLLLGFIVLFTIVPFTCSGKNPDYIVLHKHVSISVKSGSLNTRTEILLQINTREGEDAADFELNYSPAEKLKGLNAWIQDTTGKILRKLEKKNITTRSDYYSTFYSDYMVKRFDLRHNRFPYQIHLEYEYEESEFLHIADWSPVYYTNAPTLDASLTVNLPLNYPVRIFQRKVSAPVIDTIDGTVRYRWTGDYLHLIKSEMSRPPIRDLYAHVLIVPLEFEYGIKGSNESWTSFGDYIAGLMQGLDVLPASEMARIIELTSGLPDTLAKIKALYHYLQDNTRYINVSVDIGGMKPYPASYVSLNKYGDCKALTNFMKSMLAAIGIQSYYTLVTGALLPARIISDFPSQQFNHAILCLPYRSDTLWLDCTNQEIPVGHTSSFIQGRPALVVSPGHSKLVHIGRLLPQDVLTTSTYHYTELADGAMRVALHAEYRGPECEKIAYYKSFGDPENQKAMAGKLLPFKNYDLDSFKFTKQPAGENSIAFDAQFLLRDHLQSMNDKLVIALPSPEIPSFEKPTSREYPVQIPYPIFNSDTIIVTIPAGMTVKSFPSTELTCESGSYKVSSTSSGNNLVTIRDILIRSGETGPGQYPAFYSWIGAISAYERQNKIILNQTHE